MVQALPELRDEIHALFKRYVEQPEGGPVARSDAAEGADLRA